MATTTTNVFGSDILTEKKAVEFTTNNVLVIEMELAILIGATSYTFRQLPDIGFTNRFTFEINTFLRNFVKANLLSLNPATLNTGVALAYSFGANGINAGGTIINGENSGGTRVVAYNMSNDELVPINLNLFQNNTGGGTAITRLLTDYEKPRKVVSGGAMVLNSRITSNSQNWILVYTTDNLTLVAETATLPIGLTTAFSGNNRFGSGFIESFTHPTATKAFIFLADQGGGAGFSKVMRSKIYAFEKISNPCNFLEIFWINQYGVMESFLFASNYADKTSIEKSNFKTVRPVNPSALDRGQSIYKVESMRRFDVWSEFETMETIYFLNSIALSPQVAIRVNGVLVPVIVENNQVDNFNYYEPINRVTFNLAFANKRINVV